MKHLLTKTTGRRAAATLALALGVGALAATPASADEPVPYSDEWTFEDVNPCTGLEIELTIAADFRDHVRHVNNFVGHASRTGETSDGYVMDHSVASFQVNDNILREAVNDTWRHPDGTAFKAQGQLVVDIRIGDVKVDNFRLRCLGS